MNNTFVQEANAALAKILGSELAEIINAIAAEPSEETNDYFSLLPERYTVDQNITDLMALVAKTANSYHRIARFCGMAKAEFTLAEGAYKYKYKTNRVGKSDAERDRAGSEAAKEEHDALLTIEAIYNMAEKLEATARIKSESARKILDKVQAMQVASNREEAGQISSVATFKPY